MGFKPLPFAAPLYCSAKPGHILLEWYDGSIIDCESSIKVALPRQLNDFRSHWALWVLCGADSFYVGNSIGTYLEIRNQDKVLLSCGKWDKSKVPVFEEAGLDGTVTCHICKTDRRTIVSPDRQNTFRLTEPYIEVFPDESHFAGELLTTTYPVIITERGVIDFETDGAWIPAAGREGPINYVELGLRR